MSIQQYEQALQGKLLLPTNELYEEKCQIFNSAVQSKPAAIIVCETEQDIVEAVNYANARGLTIAIKGGGHHLAGFAIAEGSVAIDMSAMKTMTINEETKTVEAEAGVKAGELTAEVQKYGLAVPLGTASNPGAFGVALSGGIGYLRGVYGLACDNIIGATIVTADGEILTVDEYSHPDLLWALRGGGGNFGVVTKLVFQAYEIGTEVFALDLMYDYADAKEVFTKAQRFVEAAPNESVAVNFTVTILPPVPFLPEALHFKKVIMVLGMYAGVKEEGEAAMQPLRELAKPIVDYSAIMPYTTLQQKLDPMIPPSVNCYGTALYFDKLEGEGLQKFLSFMDAPPSPGILGQVWSLGGKMNEMTAETSPFAMRDAGWAVIVDVMAMDDDDAVCETWINDLYAGLRPYAHKKASYLNSINPTETATEDAFAENYVRLQQVKAQYDPTNVFCHNHNIKVEK